jgi:hypothetical protein
MRVEIEISNNELDALENLAIAWNLCDKHKSVDATEDEMWRFTQDCKNCVELNRKLSSKVLHVWSKLMTAYLKARKKRR